MLQARGRRLRVRLLSGDVLTSLAPVPPICIRQSAGVPPGRVSPGPDSRPPGPRAVRLQLGELGSWGHWRHPVDVDADEFEL